VSFEYETDFAPDQASGSTGVVDEIARRVSTEARADTVFGDPVSQGDVTVIPVAKVSWAFGGGAGAGGDESSEGEDFGAGNGGAAAMTAKPLGYIEIREWGTRFQPTAGKTPAWLPITAAGFALWLVLRAIGALRR
jgi:uncharacterized spore protein YtfJ